MTLSFDQSAPRGLDAMLIVYSLLDDHPASAACELLKWIFSENHLNYLSNSGIIKSMIEFRIKCETQFMALPNFLKNG